MACPRCPIHGTALIFEKTEALAGRIGYVLRCCIAKCEMRQTIPPDEYVRMYRDLPGKRQRDLP